MRAVYAWETRETVATLLMLAAAVLLITHSAGCQ